MVIKEKIHGSSYSLLQPCLHPVSISGQGGTAPLSTLGQNSPGTGFQDRPHSVPPRFESLHFVICKSSEFGNFEVIFELEYFIFDVIVLYNHSGLLFLIGVLRCNKPNNSPVKNIQLIFYGYCTFYLSIHPGIHLLVLIMNNAAVNICVQVFHFHFCQIYTQEQNC